MDKGHSDCAWIRESLMMSRKRTTFLLIGWMTICQYDFQHWITKVVIDNLHFLIKIRIIWPFPFPIGLCNAPATVEKLIDTVPPGHNVPW